MKTDVIEKLLVRDNFSSEKWEQRGLTRSDESVVRLLDSATKSFLSNLQALADSGESPGLAGQVSELIDGLPWDELDTEEKEFLADVLAPAIESLGIDPWQLL